jgi:uncharacterized membrane protein
MRINIESYPIEKIFLVLAIFFGMLFVFFIPPFQGNDEVYHFFRAYQLSQFRIVSLKQDNDVGDYLPSSIKKLSDSSRFDEIRRNRNKKLAISNMHTMSKIRVDKNDVTFTGFSNTSIYAPLSYIGLSVGIKIADIISFPLIYSFYFGRLSSFILWIIMIYFAIKITPIYKQLFFLFALMPTTLYQASTFSSDTIIIGIGLLLTAIFLYHKQDNKQINKYFIIIFIVGILALFLIKIVYLPLILLFFLIPESNFKSRKQRYVLFISGIISGLFIFLLWFLLNKNLILPTKPDVDIMKQLWFIIIHPFYYIWVIISTLSWNLFTIIGEFISHLGWNLVPAKPSHIFYIIYFTLLIICSLYGGQKDYEIKKMEKFLIAISFFLFTILLCTILYLTWTPVGRYHILGIYGRYFIPMTILPALIIYNKHWIKKTRGIFNACLQKQVLLLFSLISLSYNLLLIIFRYWEL